MWFVYLRVVFDFLRKFEFQSCSFGTDPQSSHFLVHSTFTPVQCHSCYPSPVCNFPVPVIFHPSPVPPQSFVNPIRFVFFLSSTPQKFQRNCDGLDWTKRAQVLNKWKPRFHLFLQIEILMLCVFWEVFLDGFCLYFFTQKKFQKFTWPSS